jgi:bacterioferritin B
MTCRLNCTKVNRMLNHDATETKFQALLQEQIGHEFTASQQYIAIAVYFDGSDLPQLATHFYAQALEERNHAMMLVRHLLDRDVKAEITATAPVQNDFESPRAALSLALEQERSVTEQIAAMAAAARDEHDYLGEQFMQWFLKEQVEEVASMTTLLRIADRAGANLFDLEDFVAREMGAATADPTAPTAAGGNL